MRPVEEIKTNPNLIFIRNSHFELMLKSKGAESVMLGTYIDPVTQRTWTFIFSDEPNFEHLSVSSPSKTPDWDTMCRIKDIFFDDEDECVEFHPKRSEYVNVHEHCLHIWRYKGELPKGWYER